MRILFFTNIPSPYRVDFFNQLGKTHQLTVVFEAERAPHINATWYGDVEVRNFHAEYLSRGVIRERRINWRILRHVRRGYYDAVIVTNYAYLTEMFALLALKARRIPYFLEIDGGSVQNESRLKQWYKTRLIRGAVGYFSPSEHTDALLTHYGASPSRIARYPFTSLREGDIRTTAPSRIEKESARKLLKIAEDKVVLSVGQFIPRKGFDVLLNACQYLDENTGVYLVGGEPTQEYLSIASELGLSNVHFVPFMTSTNLANYYSAADVFVLPTRFDVWGLVVNEAMARGLPVITTDKCVAGLELVMDSQNGYVVSVDDASELATRINLVLSDEILRVSMAQNALETIRGYTIERMDARHSEVLAECLRERDCSDTRPNLPSGGKLARP